MLHLDKGWSWHLLVRNSVIVLSVLRVGVMSAKVVVGRMRLGPPIMRLLLLPPQRPLMLIVATRMMQQHFRCARKLAPRIEPPAGRRDWPCPGGGGRPVAVAHAPGARELLVLASVEIARVALWAKC